MARDDGSILLTFTPPSGIDGIRVYRPADATGPVATLAAEATSYADGDTAVGEGYTYVMVAFREAQESTGCPLLEVTAIPELGSPWAMALAGFGGLAALVYGGRRRA